MVLPDIQNVREFFRILCVKLRSNAQPWCDEMALAIETALASPAKWSALPLLLKIFFERDYSSILIMAESLVAARQHHPWADLFNTGKHDNTVYGDIFDSFVKKALSPFPEITADQLPTEGKRSYDKGIVVNGVRVAVEASTLGETKVDRARWDAIFEKQQLEGSTFTTTGAYSGDPYGIILRLTEKVLDKVAKNCDVERCQLVADHPNLLCVGLPSLSARPRDHGLSWALDELFSAAPWERTPRERVKDTWSVLERKVIENGAADPAQPTKFDDFMKRTLWDKFKRVSAISIFDECRFVFSRINYHAHPANLISHSTMGAIEETLSGADWKPFAVTTAAW